MTARPKWLIPAGVVVSTAVVLAGLAFRHRRQAAQQPLPRPDAATVVAKSEITLNGSIRAQHVVNVEAPSGGGQVEAFFANVGDEVYQGQVLARIGSGTLESDREAAAHAVESAEQQVARAETTLQSAKLEESRASADAQRSHMALDRAEKVYTRQKTLHEKGATPRLVYEKAEQEYEAAVKDSAVMDNAAKAASETAKGAADQVASAKKMLDDKRQQLDDAQRAFEAAEVRAPVDGLVVGRSGEAGKGPPAPGEALFTIATDLYALEVVLEPDAATLKHIHPGQAALVSILDLQTGGIPATVKEIKDNKVMVEFGSTMQAIRPGMRAEVRLKLE